MKKAIIEYISRWEARCYSEGIPDEAPLELERRNLVPSYRRIAIAILKNDVSLKSLGLTATKSKYYDFYKRIEIEKRLNTKQLKLEI